MRHKTLIPFKPALSFIAFAKGGLLVAQDSIASIEPSREVMIYREYAERLVRLEEAKNEQFAVLLLVSLAVISFLLYKIYGYRRLLHSYEHKSAINYASRNVSAEAYHLASPSAHVSPQISAQSARDTGSGLSSVSAVTQTTDVAYSSDELISPALDPKILELASRFERLMQEDHLYRESFLTRDRVAALLETNRTYIGQVMSEVFHESFSQYINNLRINEAIAILDNPAGKRPIRLIGRDLGFNSVTTFNAQFQKRTGVTPAQYRQNVIESQKE